MNNQEKTIASNQKESNEKILVFLTTFYFIVVSLSFTILTLPFGYLALGLYKLFPNVVTKKHIRIISYYYGKFFILINTPIFPVSISNKSLAKNESPSIIIGNHQSVLDLILFGVQDLDNFVYVVKSWPFKLLFFFAPIMRTAGYINIDEHSPEEIEALCLQHLAEGTSIIIFPEGKRTRDKQLGKFHVGAFLLACKANVPVVSYVFRNCYDVFTPDKKTIKPGRIYIDSLPTIYPKDFSSYDLPHRQMMKHSYKQFKDYFENLSK